MFEFSVACKYLTPRRRQLSVSIISLISVLVIALVVWLIIVFFSVTNGLEKNWIQKLTALTAPVRMTPTDAYYQSYYYQIDSISEASDYALKTIAEKRDSGISDPYNPYVDEEIPLSWGEPDRDNRGEVKDLVKLAFDSVDEIQGIKGLHGQDFELTATHINLHLIRPAAFYHAGNVYGRTTESAISYPAYLGNFEGGNHALGHTLLDVQIKDINNLFSLLNTASGAQEPPIGAKRGFETDVLNKRLHHFFQNVDIKALKARDSGWTIPSRLLPEKGSWDVCALQQDHQFVRAVVPANASSCSQLQNKLEEQGLTATQAKIVFHPESKDIHLSDGRTESLPARFSITLEGGSLLSAAIDPSSIERPRHMEDVKFDVEIPIQGDLLKGKVPYKGLDIAQAQTLKLSDKDPPRWIYQTSDSDGSSAFVLPKDPEVGEGIALPRSFQDAGVMVGDHGTVAYYSPTASILQEQQIPIYVAGFYDPGIIPIGGKYILASREITSLIRASHNPDDKTALSNGINIRFADISQADSVKSQLLENLKKRGVSRYWNVETYRDYEFTKEIIRELQSQKNLFMLISVVIILVACSNIISMLVILVNDKKTEIGILRSMGASSASIALIFGTSGALIGLAGSAVGILAAVLTLSRMDLLIGLLSKAQGYEMFNAKLYGEILPHELSFEALGFVLGATVLISLVAGIVTAIKACLLRPSDILRSGG